MVICQNTHILDRGEIERQRDPCSTSLVIKIWKILVLGNGGERNIKWQEDGDILSNCISFRDYTERLNASLFLANCLSIIPLSALQYLPFQMQSWEAASLRLIIVSHSSPDLYPHITYFTVFLCTFNTLFPACPHAEVPLQNHKLQQPLLIVVLGGKTLPYFFFPPTMADEWLGALLGATSEPASSAVSSQDAPKGVQGWTSQASHPPGHLKQH